MLACPQRLNKTLVQVYQPEKHVLSRGIAFLAAVDCHSHLQVTRAFGVVVPLFVTSMLIVMALFVVLECLPAF